MEAGCVAEWPCRPVWVSDTPTAIALQASCLRRVPPSPLGRPTCALPEPPLVKADLRVP